MKKSFIAASLGLALFLPQAEAALFSFSYTLAGGNVLEGMLDGTLQGDNNTVVVNSIMDFASFDGVAGPALPFVHGADAFYSAALPIAPSGPNALLTLDGSYQDLIACTAADCLDGFTINAGNHIAGFFGAPVYSAGESFGRTGGAEPYNPTNWRLTAVPAPATLPLLVIGGAAMCGRRRKAA